MTSEAIRDPVKDHLLTPQNSAFILIDYQPVQVNSIASMDRQLLINNICGVSKAAVAYGLPIVHSTVNVKTGLNKPPIPQLRKVLEGVPTVDRTTINSAWPVCDGIGMVPRMRRHGVGHSFQCAAT